MPSRFVDVTDRELTQFLKKLEGLWIIITVLFIVSASLVAIIAAAASEPEASELGSIRFGA